MSTSKKYITMRSADTFWNHENDLIFEGMTYTNEEYSVAIPIHDITDVLDYIIEKRIDYITLRRKELLNEQRHLKQKLKLWKSLNT